MSSLEDRFIKVEDQLRALQMRQAAATAHPNTPPIPSPPAMRVIEVGEKADYTPPPGAPTKEGEKG